MIPYLLPSLRLSVVFVLLALAAAACVKVGTLRGGEQEPATTASLPSSKPQVSLCLSSVGGSKGHRVRAVLDAVDLSDGGQWISLLKQPLTITSGQAEAGVLLDRVQVPEGQYQRIRYQISQAIADQDGREITLQPPSQPVEYPLVKPLSLSSGDSVSLFLSWDIAASLSQAPKFAVTFSASAQRIPLTTELAFVSCPEINTVYLIRTDQNRICGSWGIPGRPTSMHADKATNTLYVLAADQSAIVAIELSSGKIRDRIRMPIVARPSFMTIDPEGRNAYLVEQATGMAYRVDLGSGSLAAQVRVGERLDYCEFLNESATLAVASSQGQKVVLLDPTTLRIRQSVAVGNAPQGVAEYGGALYVAENRANTVGLYHLGSGMSLRQQVGQGPSRILVHERTLFVANSLGGSITILRPEQLTVVKVVAIGGSPGEMAVSAARNWLYVADATGNGVTVIDLSSQRRVEGIDLKARPFDIEVIQ